MIILNKKFSFLLGIVFFFSSSVFSMEKIMPLIRFDTLYIKYIIEGEYEKGAEEVFIKGDKYLTIKEIKYTGKDKQKIMELDDGFFYYKIDLLSKTGIKRSSLIQQNKQQKTVKQHMDYTSAVTSSLKGHVKSGNTEVVLGKTCNIYVFLGVSTSIWNNIILKKEMNNILGYSLTKATILNVDAPLADNIFKVPDDVIIEDGKDWEQELEGLKQ